MPFKSQAQRKFLYKTNPELAKKFEKIHNSPSYQKKIRGRKKMNSVGGFAAAAQRRLDAGKRSIPASSGFRKAKPMDSGRSIVMPGRKAQPISMPGQGNVRRAQPVTPGAVPNKQMPAFASAARRKIAAQRNA